MSTIPKAPVTPDDLLVMPGGDRYGLVDGLLVERAMGSWAGFVAGQPFALIEYDIDDKVVRHLASGVRLVWVINSETRVVIIDRADGSIAGVREGGVVDGEDAVPGFRCRVADLFIP